MGMEKKGRLRKWGNHIVGKGGKDPGQQENYKWVMVGEESVDIQKENETLLFRAYSIGSALKMEIVFTSETLTSTVETTQSQNLEEHLQQHTSLH